MAAAAPSNYLAFNAEAQQKAIDTHGASLAKGVANMLQDAKQGHMSMTDESLFEVGKNVATTEGAVVFENEFFQLIEYKPLTDKVHEKPFLLVPPCINKFYILDLQPENSFIRYAVSQGHRTFVVSWRNPDASMEKKTWDDYIEHAAIEAIHRVQEITGQDKKGGQINALGFCVGGTILTTALAVLAARGEKPVSALTLLTTLVDFSDTGILDVFIDEACIGALEESMAKKGYLDGNDMAGSFRMLRSNPLIWHYWEHSYLLGEPLPPFDVLFWNVDSTRMPQAMHSYYLREMYLNNNLIKRDKLTIAGESIDLDDIVQPLYAVTAEDDHIAPWKQCYRIRKYINVEAPVRFVLSTSGHILGIVNPPVKPPKRSYRVGPARRTDRLGAPGSTQLHATYTPNICIPQRLPIGRCLYILPFKWRAWHPPPVPPQRRTSPPRRSGRRRAWRADLQCSSRSA